MSEIEPDWTQIDPTEDQVKAWMRERATSLRGTQQERADRLAWEANQHFARPFHIRVLYGWALRAVKSHD